MRKEYALTGRNIRMFERIKHLLIKEFLQLFRDPRMKAVVFLAPLIQTTVFGFAVSTDVTNVPMAVYDLDGSPESRELVREFTSSGYFRDAEAIGTDAEARALLDRTAVSAVLSLNRGFARDLRAGRTATLQLILDGTDSNTASVALNYAGQIVERASQRLLLARARPMLRDDAIPGVDLRVRAWFNENLTSRNFYVPGVVCLIVTLITLLLTSMAIVREKEIGTIEQLMVSPIKPHELILGKLIPFGIIGIIDVVLIAAVAVFLFHVPIRGSLALLFLCTLIYLLTTLGVGLYISTLSGTQQEAMMSTFFFFFPAILLSGFMFPIANMPWVIQLLTYLDPMRYFIIILRGIFLKGVGIAILWPEMLSLLVMGIAVLSLSVLRFKKRLG